MILGFLLLVLGLGIAGALYWATRTIYKEWDE